MILKQYTVGPIEANNYLLVDEDTKDAVLIDCSGKEQAILDDINNLKGGKNSRSAAHQHPVNGNRDIGANDQDQPQLRHAGDIRLNHIGDKHAGYADQNKAQLSPGRIFLIDQRGKDQHDDRKHAVVHRDLGRRRVRGRSRLQDLADRRVKKPAQKDQTDKALFIIHLLDFQQKDQRHG